MGKVALLLMKLGLRKEEAFGAAEEIQKSEKRYNLILPPELVARFEEMAKKYNFSVVDFIKLVIKGGLMVEALSNNPKAKLQLVEEGQEPVTVVFEKIPDVPPPSD